MNASRPLCELCERPRLPCGLAWSRVSLPQAGKRNVRGKNSKGKNQAGAERKRSPADTGMTLQYLLRLFQQRKPKHLRVAVLLDKPERRIAAVRADYVGFTIPNEFVVGYGLDYSERYRNLPYVGILKLGSGAKPQK